MGYAEITFLNDGLLPSGFKPDEIMLVWEVIPAYPFSLINPTHLASQFNGKADPAPLLTPLSNLH